MTSVSSPIEYLFHAVDFPSTVSSATCYLTSFLIVRLVAFTYTYISLIHTMLETHLSLNIFLDKLLNFARNIAEILLLCYSLVTYSSTPNNPDHQISEYVQTYKLSSYLNFTILHHQFCGVLHHLSFVLRPSKNGCTVYKRIIAQKLATMYILSVLASPAIIEPVSSYMIF